MPGEEARHALGVFRVPVLGPIREFVDGLVHPCARGDAMVAARHRTFIAVHLAAGLTAGAAAPIFLAWHGAPGPVAALALLWLVLPAALAWYVSATGRLTQAVLLAAVDNAALVVTIASATGGPSSAAMIWLTTIPAAAALSGSISVVAAAVALASIAGGGLWVAEAFGYLPASNALPLSNGTLAACFILAALAYDTALALGAGVVARVGERIRQRNEARYQLLAEYMTDLITRHAPNGAVTFVSPAAEALLGVSVTELHGDGLFARVHVADRPAYLSALGRAIAEGAPGSVEFRLRRGALRDASSTSYAWVEMNCRPIEQAMVEDGRRPVVAITRDITERKEQEAHLERARAESERANLAKTRFLATMSHELRTPLNAIIGFAELLMHGEAMQVEPEKQRDYARLIFESGHHLLGMVNGILDVSRIESGNFDVVIEPFELKPVIEGCREMIALKAEAAGLKLVSVTEPNLPEIVADKRALRQILINLLSNAVKFTKAGGMVTVTASVEHDELKIVVADTGIGIDSADLPRLGSPFFQAGSDYDRRFEGTGLGLSVVKGLVELHGGRLEIASRLGEGTTVTVRLPRDCEAGAHRAPSADVVKALPRRPARTETESWETRKRA